MQHYNNSLFENIFVATAALWHSVIWKRGQ